MMKFIYTPDAFNWHLKVNFTKTGSSDATKYTISGNYGTSDPCNDYSFGKTPCPGTCDVFAGEIFSRNCYVVNVYATSSTGMCSTPLRKLVSLAGMDILKDVFLHFTG